MARAAPRAVLVLAFGLALLLAACKPKPMGTVSGSATYREATALPADAVFQAELVDISAKAGTERQLAATHVQPVGTLPVAFTLSFPKDALIADHAYGITAHIDGPDHRLFETDGPVPVLTLGHGDKIELVLRSTAAAKAFTGFETEGAAIDQRAGRLRRVEGTFDTEGHPGSYAAYLDENGVPLLIQEGHDLGPQGSSAVGFYFKDGVLFRYTEDSVRRLDSIGAPGAEEVIALKLYFDRGHYVGGKETVNGQANQPLPTEIPEAIVNAEVAKLRVAAGLEAHPLKVPAKPASAPPPPAAKPAPGKKKHTP